MLLRAVLLAAVLAGVGCATESTANRPFTEDWAYVRERGDDAPKVGGDIVLTDGGRVPETAVHVDEDGTPELRIGNNSRWHTGVSIDGGDPELRVKYRVEF